ncbi:guanylate kinase [Undibacterium sp. 5I1]|uniref:guanylate kinase n=1 Tax=unclassified Undibacterium TaxID=2630295 RepID=UPI002AB40897|nr:MULTISPECIES: guanylate kinase [unclassified Undibacterium]MDY7537643.1 guanylate kinase [Undibacterium sp. 5I1]MEB0230188.1 guanylate kinase [Undibacterium sp. 10I3]MEB0256380.1 guanylate kinase [Undibacterium sp. 5I1]
MKRITTLTGPSCAGKSTLENMLAERGCLKGVSTTTRSPRPGEKEGVDYYFVSKSEFKRLAAQGAFIEAVPFGDHMYGMSVMEVNRLFAQGDHIVIVCEPIGAAQIRLWVSGQEGIKLTQAFVDNPNSVIAERFLDRVTKEMAEVASKGSSADAYAKVSKTYADRLNIIMTVESHWREKATEYDMYLSRFDAQNCNAAADLLAIGATHA